MDSETLLGIGVVVLIFGGIPMGVIGVGIGLLHRQDAGAGPTPEAPAVNQYRTPRPLGDVTAFLIATVAGVLIWVAWLSWGGNRKDYDPGQVVGCVLTGIVAVVVLGFLTRWRRTGPLSVGLGALAGFSTAWAVWAGAGDDTGQWGGGYFFLLIGGGAALAALCLAVIFLRWIFHPHHDELSGI